MQWMQIHLKGHKSSPEEQNNNQNHHSQQPDAHQRHFQRAHQGQNVLIIQGNIHQVQ